MSHYILYYRGAYNIYSTVVDRPLFEEAVTLEQLIQYIKEKYGTTGMKDLPGRLERAHKNESSCPFYTSLTQAVSLNHAGEDGTHLSTAEFIKKFLVLKDKE